LYCIYACVVGFTFFPFFYWFVLPLFTISTGVRTACWGPPLIFAKLFTLGWSKDMVRSTWKPCFQFGGCNEKTFTWFVRRTAWSTSWTGKKMTILYFNIQILNELFKRLFVDKSCKSSGDVWRMKMKEHKSNKKEMALNSCPIYEPWKWFVLPMLPACLPYY
jgi:hypothetical protein